MAALTTPIIGGIETPHFFQKTGAKLENPVCSMNFAVLSQKNSDSQNGRGRKVWRRRKLTKKVNTMDFMTERVPFLEEKVRKIREEGNLFVFDAARLLLSEENRFDFVNSVAAEAKQYVDNNREEYGAKKALLHVITNRINDVGFYRADAYLEPDPYKPGPGQMKNELM